MPNLNQMELQHLRHLIGAHETTQMFTKSAQDALNTKQKLMSFLGNNN